MTSTTTEEFGKQEKLGFAAAWLGWAFDGLDGFMYTLVAIPLVAGLMNLPGTDPDVKYKAALIQAVFLVGWALGGAVFGRIGDALGRTKTLSLTILFYAAFTGLCFFATEWWHLLIFRFLAALGIGGEWAAGAALVGETVPKRLRHWASALLQSGYMFGMILAAFTVRGLSAFPHKTIFLVGVLPALLTLWIRRAVPEPEEWVENKQNQEMPKMTALFSPEVLPATLKVLVMSTITLLGAWTILYFGPGLIRSHPENKGLSKAQLDLVVSNGVILFTCVNIAGNFFMAFLTQRIGYRKGFILALSAALFVFLFGFVQPRDLASSQMWISAAGVLWPWGVWGISALFPDAVSHPFANHRGGVLLQRRPPHYGGRDFFRRHLGSPRDVLLCRILIHSGHPSGICDARSQAKISLCELGQGRASHFGRVFAGERAGLEVRDRTVDPDIVHADLGEGQEVVVKHSRISINREHEIDDGMINADRKEFFIADFIQRHIV